MEKTITQTTITTITPEKEATTAQSTALLSGVSLREKKLEEKIRHLEERLHDLKRMTIDTHIQKHMYQLQARKEWQDILQEVNKILAKDYMPVADRITEILWLQDKMLAYIAFAVYTGALRDAFDEIDTTGTSLLEEIAQENEAFMQDIIPYDIHPVFNIDTTREFVRSYITTTERPNF